MEDHLNQIKIVSDQLSLSGSLIEDEDLVLFTLNGLPDEYNAFKTTIQARSDPISIATLSALLCSESIYIETSLKQTHASDLPFAYAATRGNYRGFKGSQRGGHRGHREVEIMATDFQRTEVEAEHLLSFSLHININFHISPLLAINLHISPLLALCYVKFVESLIIQLWSVGID